MLRCVFVFEHGFECIQFEQFDDQTDFTVRIFWLDFHDSESKCSNERIPPHGINFPPTALTSSDRKKILQRLNKMAVSAALNYNESNIQWW